MAKRVAGEAVVFRDEVAAPDGSSGEYRLTKINIGIEVALQACDLTLSSFEAMCEMGSYQRIWPSVMTSRPALSSSAIARRVIYS